MSKLSRKRSRRHKSKLPKYSSPSPVEYHSSYAASKPARPEPLHPAAIPLTTEQRSALEETIRRNLDLDALGLDLRSPVQRLGVGLYRADKRIAAVSLKQARVGTNLPLGDFLTDDAPWDRVFRYLTEALDEAPRPEGPPAIADPRVVTALPSGISEAVRTFAQQSSTIIRENFRDYPVPLHLDAPNYSITFWPLDETGDTAVVPFAFAPAIFPEFIGGLCLRQPLGDVMPVRIPSNAIGDELRTAWIVAISDFAKLLTLAAADDPADATSPNPISPAPTPIRLVNSNVAGHKRKLPRGHRGRDGARQLASFFGVALADGETWVRKHTRGTPGGGAVSMEWTPAIEIDDISSSQRRAA